MGWGGLRGVVAVVVGLARFPDRLKEALQGENGTQEVPQQVGEQRSVDGEVLPRFSPTCRPW